MARQFDPKSKIGIIKNLEVNGVVSFPDAKFMSLTVQISNLKKQSEYKDRKFKVSFIDGVTIVKRIL